MLVADTEVVARLRAGDEAAFAGIVRAWSPAMLRVARAHVHSHATAEEVVQETWIGVIAGLDGFEERSSLKTWIFRILINRAMSRGKREKRVVPFSSLAPAGEPEGEAPPADRFLADGHWATPPRPFEAPADRMALIEFRARLREALVHLPERQQIVVTLRDVEGLSSDEVCSVLSISEANQRVLLHRGRSAIRNRLEEQIDA